MYIEIKQRITKLVLALFAFSICALFSGVVAAQTLGEVENPTQIPEKPQRIVVLPLFAEEMLLEMIGPDRIVGVWHEYYENGEAFSPTIALTRNIQGGLTIDNAEGILAVDPDLVILWKADYYHYETLLPTLERANVPFFFMDEPQNFADVKDSLTILGGVVGAPEKASQMVQVVEAGLEELAQIVISIPKNERIRVTNYRDYYPMDVYDAIANAAGVISDGGTVFNSRHYDYLEIDDKILSDWNPNLITFLPYDIDSDGSIIDIGKNYVDAYIAYLLEKPGLSTISAIQTRNIHPLCTYNSQYMVQSAMSLARLAYPELFSNL